MKKLWCLKIFLVFFAGFSLCFILACLRDTKSLLGFLTTWKEKRYDVTSFQANTLLKEFKKYVGKEPNAVDNVFNRITDVKMGTRSVVNFSQVESPCEERFKSWYRNNEHYSNPIEIDTYMNIHCKDKKDTCFVDNLNGPLFVDRDAKSESDLYKNELKYVKTGGWWHPENCSDTQQTAIIIPYRDRLGHLMVLLNQIHPILKRQQLHYRIFIIEQDDPNPFNRGKLMNVGFKESRKYFPYSCFVFHDVDLIPEDDRIGYACNHSPMHLSVAVDKFHYHLPYAAIFGGIEMFTHEDFEKVNGFPNSFWHWGGEDDNLYYRCVTKHRMSIKRQSTQIARYSMLNHTPNEKEENKAAVVKFLTESFRTVDKDGLNNLQYLVKSKKDHLLYTLIKVDLKME